MQFVYELHQRNVTPSRHWAVSVFIVLGGKCKYGQNLRGSVILGCNYFWTLAQVVVGVLAFELTEVCADCNLGSKGESQQATKLNSTRLHSSNPGNMDEHQIGTLPLRLVACLRCRIQYG